MKRSLAVSFRDLIMKLTKTNITWGYDSHYFNIRTIGRGNTLFIVFLLYIRICIFFDVLSH